MTTPRPPAAVFEDALRAAALVAVDPAGLGGLAVRGGSRAVVERVAETLAAGLPRGAPVRRLPARPDDDRLDGGLDLAATLALGRPVHGRGLLAEADGGLVVAPMAERMTPSVAARVAAALDAGAVTGGPAGTSRTPARFAVLALDEGGADDARPPAALLDRVALQVDLDIVALADAVADIAADCAGARQRLASIRLTEEALAALADAAEALGIPSPRALLLACRAARAAAALAGRPEAADEDLALAARLVLAPRATRLPVGPSEAPPPSEAASGPGEGEPDEPGDGPLADRVVEAAEAALPADLVARLAGAARSPAGRTPDGRGGPERPAFRGGEPLRSRPGRPVSGARLDLVETLRAAVPLRSLRPPPRAGSALAIRAGDLRIRRFRRRTRTTTVFVVDASGSSALHRLAEAKGAVERVLGEAYVRRDRVALIAFRGSGAETLLPPTASLTRARRLLADMPAGGGTPLAAGAEAALALVGRIAGEGEAAVVVFLTDGQANVGRDGAGGRARAEADALAAGRALAAARVPTLVIDIAARPEAKARAFAEAAGGDYLPLPRADAERLAAAVREAGKGRAA